MPSSSPPANRIRRCQPWLGTFVEITADDVGADAVSRAFAEISQVHERMSFHSPASDLAIIHAASPGERIAVSSSTIEVLRFAIELHQRSSGMFDISVASALVARGLLPRSPAIDLRKMKGTSSDIEIISDTSIVLHRRLLLDLGGIAKGYAVDRAINVLTQAGASHAVVNAGGDLRVLGEANINLRDADGICRQAVDISNGAIATSSNRFTRRRHRGRIEAPHVGRGRRSQLVDDAVSVVAPTCMSADALTKVVIADFRIAHEVLAGYGAHIVGNLSESGIPS